MNILSLHVGSHDSVAAVFRDYDLLGAVQQERMTRRKGDGGLPRAAMAEALAAAGLQAGEIDVLVLSRAHYPMRFFSHFSLYKRVEDRVNRLFGKERRKDVVSELQATGKDDARSIFRTDRILAELGLRPDVEVAFSNHHLSHALGALFYTDWDDALLYTADGCGDNTHYSHRLLQDGQLQPLFGGEEVLHERRRVDSLGLAYGYMTRALGFRMNRHEGKLTGLAAFGKPLLVEAIGQHFTVDDEGRINSDFASDKAMDAFITEVAATVDKADAAASIQEVLEQKILASVKVLLAKTGARRLGLAGGVFANVRLNRLLCEATGVDEIFIFPGMGDEGLSVGGALEFLLNRDGLHIWLKNRRRLDSVYLGRDYSAETDTTLAADPTVERLPGNPVEVCVDLMAKGQAGAIFEGRMEFGPRALGARSIIASPTDSGINQSLNDRLNRTEFMPFAPYVLAEDARMVFDVTDANRYACRFMTITTAVREEWQARIPAVVHVDGTARPQIIDDAANPLYAAILRRFKEVTGLPVLVNTSFNAHEEPIINTPAECLKALKDDRIDFVVTQGAVWRRAQGQG